MLCGICGNNTCNGCCGQVDGKDCGYCDDADVYWRETDYDKLFEQWLDINIGNSKTNPYWEERLKDGDRI